MGRNPQRLRRSLVCKTVSILLNADVLVGIAIPATFNILESTFDILETCVSDDALSNDDAFRASQYRQGHRYSIVFGYYLTLIPFKRDARKGIDVQ